MSPTVTTIVEWLRQRMAMAGARGLVVGLSGGMDSAVVVRLCQLAASGQVVGLIMPCGSDPQDESDARLVADHFHVTAVSVNLDPAYDALVDPLRAALDGLAPDRNVGPDQSRVPLANIRPRLRMTALYFVANSLDYLVVGAGNRSALMIGYFTKHGDGGADVLPIGHLLKGQVRALATELGVPASVIARPPSAGLWSGQTDEAELGFSYADLERYLGDGPEAVSPALALRLERLIRSSEHKRELAPTP